MKKIILKIIAGIGSSIFGIYLLFLYLSSLQDGNNLLFLGGSLVLFGVGGFLLYKASQPPKSDIAETSSDTIQSDEEIAKILKKNNDIASEWNNTVKKQDKMKMLEISSTPVNPE